MFFKFVLSLVSSFQIQFSFSRYPFQKSILNPFFFVNSVPCFHFNFNSDNPNLFFFGLIPSIVSPLNCNSVTSKVSTVFFSLVNSALFRRPWFPPSNFKVILLNLPAGRNCEPLRRAPSASADLDPWHSPRCYQASQWKNRSLACTSGVHSFKAPFSKAQVRNAVFRAKAEAAKAFDKKKRS